MSLDPNCLARLKLRQHPFDGLPAETFLYSDPLLESLVETAARALGDQGAVVILAGPDGSGRSVQLMRLLGVLEGQYELIAFRSRPNIPFDAVDVTIRAHLRAAGLDRPARTVAELLSERAQGQTRLVLAIDDAHLLGPDGLVKLIRLRAAVMESGGLGLRLILVGDPALARHPLPLPDLLEDTQVARLNLRPLNLEQAGAYLRHRLRAAGLDDPDALLSRGDIAVLQGSAKGLPAALNVQATAWLARRCRSLETGLKAVLGGRVATNAPTPPEPSPPSIVSDEAPEPLQAPFEPKPDVYEPSPRPSREPQLSDFLRSEEAPTALAQSEFEEILKRVRQHQPWDALPEPKAASREEIRAVTANKPPKPPATPYWSRPWFIPLILAMVLTAIAAPVFWQLARDARRSVALDRPAQSVKPALPTSKPQPESNALAPATPEPQSATASEAPQPVLDGRPDQPSTEPAASTPLDMSSRPADELAEDLAWLTRQDPERFTIQLVAARDLATARRVLEPHGLEGVHYIQTRSYVIAVIGSFPSRAQAARELPALPAGVRDNGPWIRTIGSIRDNLP